MKRREGTTPVYVFLATPDHERLKALAKRRGRSMTILVEDLVREWLDAEEARREPRGGEQ